jgi:hypothetical protein
MIYKLSVESIMRNLISVIVMLVLAICAIILFIDNIASVIAIAVITLTLLSPQIYLAIQYIKYSNYNSFEIDYQHEVFVIKKSDQVITRDFSSLKIIQYHKAAVPRSSLSLAFTLAEYCYYYRLEFVDGSTYYLTNLLSPNPVIEEKGAMYAYFTTIERKYASIKP